MTEERPRRGRPTAAAQRERRLRMLDASLPVFLEHGYQRSTIDQLARASGVTKRTIYTDYGDKAGLFGAMVEHLASEISQASGASDGVTLSALAARIVFRVYSDELVGLHRLVIAETPRFPELADTFHSQTDARHIAALRRHLAKEHPDAPEGCAEALFSLLLGENHRKRLLGVAPAVTAAQARAQAVAALDRLGLA